MDKARGRNHIKNKTKYKPKGHNKLLQQDNIKDVVGVTSLEPNNWDRYEEPDEDDYIQNQNDLTNFATLARAPISHGGHFQFKSDKTVQSQAELDGFQKSDLFSLNLDLVSFSLATIPFSQRIDLDEALLLREQVDDMHERARQNKMEYENFLKFKDKLSDEREHEEGAEMDELQKDYDVLQGLGDLAFDSKELNVARHGNKVKEDEEDLEQWLEDVLND